MLKRYSQIIIVVIIGLLIALFDITYKNIFLHRNVPSGNRVIIIDAGHGGRDPGAIGRSGTLEKDVNLKISQKLKGYLEEHGNTVIMIREVDEGLYAETDKNRKSTDMKNRKEIIKEYRADVFISIHLNSFPQSQYYGAQVFYNRDDEKSKRLAKITQEELIKVLDRNNRREEKANNTYYILKDNPVPSILVECGFLSNPEEERLLNQEDYQNKIAWAIYCGITRYFTEPQLEN
ncbi:N-acetylmuramoyl-L-alanine amidase CwlD [Fonticella tunisiensis]|uniref:N-acetylmuramoyl-L-alanine amidase n=1 Tax=Fonticella tunisiensis TaxID=1096341 RepID=A0A4R7K9G7_9CLOT|nr:N-acetylmuramoyl-L-alanine amidase CwlD [Fonticella tunisiensis]TDT50392.1 N-acetylmuramoyl-L-alanine amidase [Fonticella tunisiensis]